jgi:HTH-type transcriptional regulator/antitoxin HigA
LARQRTDFIDAETGDQQDEGEQDADQFARDILIPPDDYATFVSAGSFTEQAVRSFAKREGVAPGIVVGRLQREDLLPKSHLNNLKKSIHPAQPHF